MAQKVEFASEAWFDGLKELLPAYAAAAGPDLKLTLCEVFTGVPGHLDPDGHGVIAWHCRISDGKVAFARTETADADFKSVVDYQAVLPLARFVVTLETRVAYEALVSATAAAGKMTRTGDAGRIPRAFYGMHNALAVRTA
jgi:hypothetical protein